MLYDYVALPDRPPLRWPHGARVALIFTINIEYWEMTRDSAEPLYPGGPATIPHALPGNVPDYANWTWREYGQRVGVWRIIDVFDRAGVPATCTMNALTGIEATAHHRRRQRTRLGDPGPQLRPERRAHLLREPAGPGAGGNPPHPGCLCRGGGTAGAGVAVVVAPEHPRDAPHPEGAGTAVPGGLPERRPALSAQHPPRPAGVHPLLQRRQRLRGLLPRRPDHLPGPGAVQGAVRPALPGRRRQRPHHERRHAPPRHGPGLRHPRPA